MNAAERRAFQAISRHIFIDLKCPLAAALDVARVDDRFYSRPWCFARDAPPLTRGD